jgi:hypothetical protein
MSGKYQTTDYIAHFAHMLRSADPKAYESFITALDAYATEITVAVTDAPAAEILNMQGRAKQTLVFLALLRTPKPIASTQQQQTSP